MLPFKRQQVPGRAVFSSLEHDMMNYDSIRSSFLKELKPQMTGPSFDAWVKDIQICKLDEALCIAYLGVPDIPGRNVEQIVSILQNRYCELLETTLGKVLHERYRVVVKMMAEYEENILPKLPEEEDEPLNQPVQSTSFGPQYSFDSFVVGEGNRLAHAAAIAVAASPGEAYNPVYIYGASGMGKTHLLQAIGKYIRESRPQLLVHYVSAENFTNELIMAIQKNATQEFKKKYRGIDVLLIDDIQFFWKNQGKPGGVLSYV